ncbi:MAG TPA: phosphodiester glycosidase family protein [Candidatus Methylacidiphilales bacterium]|nr:phosphodiester glycosidase family protein [Candidatus Methylacidiphilales bacterium]
MPFNFTFLRSRVWLFAWAGWCGLTALDARANDAVPAGLQAATFRGQSFWIRTVDPGKEDLRLFWKDGQGKPLRDFAPLAAMLTADGRKAGLSFAANAGMFEADSRPVGLLVEDGKEESPLNLGEGAGNFYMKPNGVFLINQKRRAMVVEASSYTALLTPVIWATQSGPLLVNEGDIHPDFIEGSANKKLRSGVGVRKDGIIVFAISRGPVNFYDFAYFFLHSLNCPNALYLDGEISAFYVPGMKSGAPHQFGPMFGLIKNGAVPFTRE